MPGAYAHMTLANCLRETHCLEAIPNFPVIAIKAVLDYFEYVELGAVSPDYPYLAIDTFADEILSKAQQREGSVYTLDEVIDAACAQFRCEPATLRQPGKVRPMTAARALAAAVVQASPHLRLTDLAMGLGRDVSALGKAAQRLTSDEEGRAAIAGMVARLQSAGMRMQEQNQSKKFYGDGSRMAE